MTRLSESELISRYIAPHINKGGYEDNRDGDAQGGNAQGGNAQGGDAQGGDAQGGDAQGGDAQDGDAQDGDAQGGNAKGLLDDTAFLPAIEPDSRYAVSLDTMVEGVHIFRTSNASDWAHRLLAANLSDMAAQSARPRGLLLSLSLPRERAESFIAEFAPEFARGCRENEVQWLGGDLTSSATSSLATSPAGITASATIFGSVAQGIDPRRAHARAGDALLATGELGLSALGLFALKNNSNNSIGNNVNNNIERAILRYKRPITRWRESLKIGTRVRAMMDLSDGLVSDLEKLCAASNLGAEVWLDRLPIIANIDEAAIGFSRESMGLPIGLAVDGLSAGLFFALTGGEDFELLISAPLENVASIRASFSPTPISQIGLLSDCLGVRYLGVRYLTSAGKDSTKESTKESRDEQLRFINSLRGFDHFTE